MSKELVIGSNRHETKVAVLEDDQLVELYFQRANEYSLAGSIHKGRVTRVLPGMQSAFVDLGLERDTFLYVSDFFEEHDDIDTVSDEKPVSRGRERGATEGAPERSRDERGARDERGREDRGRRDRGNRAPFERPTVTVIEPETVIVSAAGVPPARVEEFAPEADEPFDEPEDTAEPENGIASLPGETRAVAASTPGGAVRPANDDRDRNNDRGDRKGRRSRRRRGRGGRGIPETKYAQPGSGDAPLAAPEASAAVVERNVEPFSAPADVIILPGESLAKYRTRGDVGREPEVEPEPIAIAAPEDDEGVDSDDVDTDVIDHEEIAAEADALQLADKVFGHRDENAQELVEEQKLEMVSEDHPALEEHETSSASMPLEDISPLEHMPWSVERRAAEEVFSNVVPIRDEDEDEEPFEHVAPLSPAEAFEAEVEELDATGSIASVHELAPEIEEALEKGEFEAGPAEGAEASTTPQTASLRDQGGRYPHRSRRMRRRRGGNRGGSEGPTAGPVAAVASPAAMVTPVVEVETRETRAESPYEEQSAERPDRGPRVMPSISDLLKAGQEIIVQIAKEPLGQKGARITSHIALPGRYVVFMPSVNHLGVSRKVESDEERQRLKRILQAHRVGTTGGFIVRTAGEGVPEEEIAADMNFLYTLWLDIRQKAEKKPAPVLLHYDLDVVQRILRDQITEDFKAIWVDNEDLYESVLTFMQRFQPALVNRVKMYTRSAPIFDAFNITQELEKALRPKVWLKSGGYLVINQTEALVAIDINTGKYVGRSNRLEDTIVKTNTEAVKEIVRQVRLRDLGGIIVVDFIDMDERKNRQKVMQALEEAMRADKAPYKILQFNDFGLVAITRKRVKQSLERTLCAPCHYCEGAGYIKSTQTVIGEILIEAQKIAKAIEGKDVLLRVHPEVAKVLKASDNKYLEELEEILGRPVLVKGDTTLHSEKFDLG